VRGLLLDRDGTLVVDTGYLRDPGTVTLIPGAVQVLSWALAQAEAELVVVSNQSGLARGLISAVQADAVHARIVELLAAEGVRLAAAYYCPHGPGDGCGCRKPAPGLLLQAARERGLDLGASVMVGDKTGDVEAGMAAGCGLSLRLSPADPSPAAAAAAWNTVQRRLADFWRRPPS
jgi:D-glycero-D-manno-heptose 1,7-bisphosphate phosphatase